MAEMKAIIRQGLEIDDPTTKKEPEGWNVTCRVPVPFRFGKDEVSCHTVS